MDEKIRVFDGFCLTCSMGISIDAEESIEFYAFYDTA